MNLGLTNISASLFALSIILVFDTKFRLFPGFGLGEVLLSVAVLSHLLSLRTRSFSVASLLHVIMLFFVLIIFMMAGILNNILFIDTEYQTFDFFIAISGSIASAFSLLIFVSFLSLRKADKFLYYYTNLGFIHGVIILVMFILGFQIVKFGGRLSGFSMNPNQLALMLLPLPLLTIVTWKRRKIISNVTFFFVFVFCGYLTKSDALIYSWIIATLICLTYLISRSKSQRIYASRILSIVILSVLSLIILRPYIYASIYSTSSAEGDQGGARLNLWLHGIQALRQSNFIGLGPGAYSGNLYPFGGMESHNTFIDFSLNYGMISGIILYLGLIFIIFRLVLKKKLIWVALISSLVSFSLFHYIARQPTFWMFIGIIVFILEDKKSSNASSLEGEKKHVWN